MSSTTTESKAKYRALKRKLRFLIYEQECFQEELRRAQRKLLKISRDKSFLLDRLLQYERVEGSSSDSASTASSDSEKESKRVSEAKKQKKKAKPMKVKVKKRKQRQLKSLLSGDRKPLPGNLNYTAPRQQQQQQQQQATPVLHNPKLIDLMNMGSPNIQLPPNPLATLGLPMPSQDSLFPGVGLHSFTPSPSLGTQRPSKLSSLLASDSSAMNALMRAGLAAAAAGEKAEKQSRKKQKKDLDKLQTPLHPGIYPSSFSPPLSFQQSPSLEKPSAGKSPPVSTSNKTSSSSSLLLTDMADTRQGASSTKTTATSSKPKTGVTTAAEEGGEELVMDLPID